MSEIIAALVVAEPAGADEIGQIVAPAFRAGDDMVACDDIGTRAPQPHDFAAPAAPAALHEP